MKKIVISLALFVVTIGAVLAIAVDPIKKWDDSTSDFIYVWPVTSDNVLDIDTKKFPLKQVGTVVDNGTLAVGGRYLLGANGASLTISDNSGTLNVGDSISLILGNGITLGAGAGALLTIDSANGHNLSGASGPLTVNGTTIQTIDLTYVGSTTGYRVSVQNTEI